MPSPSDKRPNLWQVIVSVVGAIFGIQSNEVRTRDFTHGKPWVFILAGVVAAIVLVLLIIGVVQIVLPK